MIMMLMMMVIMMMMMIGGGIVMMMMMMMMMIGVWVSIKSVELTQPGRLPGLGCRSGGRLFQSLAVLGKNECK